ncbi:hypothetical protein HDU97_010350 [Phlyctochytrium planicorne]|nr:hypothetical protein HDU97_010350 [Phlyctochytrium planicorne]
MTGDPSPRRYESLDEALAWEGLGVPLAPPVPPLPKTLRKKKKRISKAIPQQQQQQQQQQYHASSSSSSISPQPSSIPQQQQHQYLPRSMSNGYIQQPSQPRASISADGYVRHPSQFLVSNTSSSDTIAAEPVEFDPFPPNLYPNRLTSDMPRNISGKSGRSKKMLKEELMPDTVDPNFIKVPLPQLQFILVFIGLSLAILLAALDQTIVSTALKAIIFDIGGQNLLPWVGSAYLLTATSSAGLYGKLADIFGRKMVFLFSIVIFEAGSLVSAIASTMPVLIIGRAISGVGGGGIFSLVLIIISDVVSIQDRGKYQGIIGAVFGLASVIGPLIGGAFSDHIGWRWCFWINLPIGFITVITVSIFLKFPPPEGSMKEKLARVDYLGAFLLFTAVSALITPLQLGGTEWDWNSTQVIALLCVSAVLWVAFVFVELKAKEAIIPPSMFMNRSVYALLIIAVLLGAGFFSAVYYISLYFQVVFGQTATQAGVQTIPLVMGVVVISIISGQVVSRTGHYVSFIYIGGLTMIAGTALTSTLVPSSSLVQQILYLFILGFGVGCLIQIRILALQASVEGPQIAVATAVSSFAQTLGGSIGVAIIGTIFNNVLKNNLKEQPFLTLFIRLLLKTDDPTKMNTVVLREILDKVNQPDLVQALVDSFTGAFSVAYKCILPFPFMIFVMAFLVKQYKLRKDDKDPKAVPMVDPPVSPPPMIFANGSKMALKIGTEQLSENFKEKTSFCSPSTKLLPSPLNHPIPYPVPSPPSIMLSSKDKDVAKSAPTLKKTSSMMKLRKMLSFSTLNDEAPEPMVDDKKANVIPVESTAVEIDDLKWVLEPSSSNESYTFYLTLDNGIYMNIQVAYSTMGSNPITGTRVTIQYATKIYLKDGRILTKTAPSSAETFKLSEDKLDLDGGAINIKFNHSTMAFTVEFKPDEATTIAFVMSPESEFFKVNDGAIFFKGEDEPGKGYVNTQFLPRGRVTGKMVVDGEEFDMAGLGVFRHVVQHQPLSVGKWNIVNFHSKDVSVLLYEFEMPPGTNYLRDIVCIGAIVKDKKLFSVTTENRVIHSQKVKDDVSGYFKPTEVKIHLGGPSFQSGDISCELIRPLKAPIDSIDILAELPYALRVIIQTFVTAPYMYYFGEEDVKMKIVAGAETVETTGKLFFETAFLSKKFR